MYCCNLIRKLIAIPQNNSALIKSGNCFALEKVIRAVAVGSRCLAPSVQQAHSCSRLRVFDAAAGLPLNF
jgi:phosphoribosylaminoimidazole-succinocarboxamide synthase